MVLYVTKDSRKAVRRCIGDAACAVISVPDVIAGMGYKPADADDEFAAFVISAELERLLEQASNSKRFHRAVYIVDDISPELPSNLRDAIRERGLRFHGVVLVDIHGSLEDIHHLFDSVVGGTREKQSVSRAPRTNTHEDRA